MQDSASATHSRFGGLWLDRANWRQRLSAQVAAARITAEEAAQLTHFTENGFLILERAAPDTAIDAFRAEIARAFREGHNGLLYQNHADHTTRRLTAPVDRLGTRVVDSYAVLPQALDLFTTPVLLRMLTLIFDAPPLLFQSLSFDQGSQQGLHQDTAYVVVDQPLALAACWIALEDIRAGAGELMYVPGSHRLPDWDFGRGQKHWSGDEDDSATHDAWCRWLITESAARSLPQARFFARKGDILIWHADLAHGGAPVEDASLTRQSLVGHFCPAAREPHYFRHPPRRSAVRQYRGLAYASGHYDLGDLPPIADPAAHPPSGPFHLLKKLFGGVS